MTHPLRWSRNLKNVVKKRGDRDTLLALAGFAHEAGDPAGAQAAMNMLQSINPDDPALMSGRR